VYGVSIGALNAGLILLSLRLLFSPDRAKALFLFKFSMLYLAFIFVAMAIDRSLLL
jgi:protoheme IX farnesyltransferase